MPESVSTQHQTNPFSTRHVRPGALPFFFREGESAQAVISRLRARSWWGAIIGPHGSGKSTLVAALLPEIQAAGRKPILHTFHDGIIHLPVLSRQALRLHSDVLLIIDGYEQLSAWQKFRVRCSCRKTGSGLVVTAHSSTGLPELYRTSMTPDLAERVFGQLTRNRPALANASELQDCLAARQGNLREALFDLYDMHERRRQSQEQESS